MWAVQRGATNMAVATWELLQGVMTSMVPGSNASG